MIPSLMYILVREPTLNPMTKGAHTLKLEEVRRSIGRHVKLEAEG